LKNAFDLFFVAGVDEVGRGPLAGPVVAAAVILDPSKPIEGLTDSKKLSEKKRIELDSIIKERALCYAIAEVSHEVIDAVNILQASLQAMAKAVSLLKIVPHKVLADGNKKPDIAHTCIVEAIVGGDLLIPCISAASIIAKQYRDRLMVAYDAIYPGYGFAQHKGYPTKAHCQALINLGVSDIHRRSFAPVKNALAK
jgi:ribonuclease HII